MPIYEYRCQQCGADFELLRSVTASDEDLACPVCGTPDPSRKLSVFAASGAKSAECNTSGGT